MNIKRVNSYNDYRFSQTVLYQHGAYLIGDISCEVEIVSPETAVVRGENKLAAIKTFVKSHHDVIIQVWPWNGQYVALDGHTRLYLAALKQYAAVRAM